VAARVGRDPDVLPGGRDDERPDAIEGRAIADQLSVRTVVDESLALAHAPQAWFIVCGVDEAGLVRGLGGRIGGDG
jgi:hypothetical protein